MRKRHIMRKGRSERGMALAVAIVTLLIITSVVAVMILSSSTETAISGNFKDEQTSFYAARAGVEEVRDRLRTNSPNSSTLSASLPATLPGVANGVLYVTNPANGETVAPWNTSGNNYPDDEICKELNCSTLPGGWYIPTAASADPTYAMSPVLPWKWVRVMMKINRNDTGGVSRVTSVDGTTSGLRVCWNSLSNSEVTIANTFPDCKSASGGAQNLFPVYELTALAVTPTGSRRMIQYEIAPIGFPNMPSAMTFDGPGADYSTNPNSGVFHVDGNDSHLGCPGAPIPSPAIGGYSNNDVSTITGQLNRPNSYQGTGGTPSVSNVSSGLGPLGSVDGLQQLVDNITAAAGPNVYTSPAAPTNLGTPSNPVINVVNGDFTLNGGTAGAGVLLVTGTLTLSGNPNWNGVILVIGKGQVIKNGGGNGYVDGSLFVADMYSDPPTFSNRIPLGQNLPPGPPKIAWNGGGNATIRFDSCFTATNNSSFPYKAIADRELVY